MNQSRHAVLFAVLASSLSILPPSAAKAEETTPVRVGLGFAITPVDPVGQSEFRGALPISLVVPVDIGSLRLEPWLGFVVVKGANQTEDRSLEAGLGIFGVARPVKEFAIYGGGRLGFRHRTESTYVQAPPFATVTMTADDTILAAAAGGEWYPTPRFSIGAEAQVAYVHLGIPTMSDGKYQTPYGVSAADGQRIGTRGLLIARFFFN